APAAGLAAGPAHADADLRDRRLAGLRKPERLLPRVQAGLRRHRHTGTEVGPRGTRTAAGAQHSPVLRAAGMSRARPFHPAVAIAFGGLVAGSLDILYAMAFWWLKAGVSPLRILQSVAAGALGPASFDGGAASATLGLVLHFAIATAMAAAYV